MASLCKERPALIDNGRAPEIYLDGLGHIEIIGNNVCWAGFRYRRPIVPGLEPDRVLALTAITPISAVPDIAEQIAFGFGDILISAVTRKLLRLSC